MQNKFEFLNDARTEIKSIVNAFNPYTGSFHIQGDDIETFFAQLNEEYKNGTTQNFAEKQMACASGILLDFDCFQNDEVPQITNNHVEKLVILIAKTLNKIISFDEFDEFHIAVIKRPLVQCAVDPTKMVLRYSEKHKSHKDGLHLLIPEIQISREQKKYLIAYLAADIESKKIFGDCVFNNAKLDPILDRGSAHVPPFFVGSIKPTKEKRDHYPLSFVYKIETDCDASDDIQWMRIPVKKVEKQYNIPLEMSLNRWGIEKMMHKRERTLSEFGEQEFMKWAKERNEIERNKMGNDEKYRPNDDKIQQINENPDDFYTIIENILQALDESRSLETAKWYGVMKVLRNFLNVFDLDNAKIYRLFDEFSKGGRYIGSYDEIVEKFENIEGSGHIGLLWHWLYNDNPHEFKTIIREYSRVFPELSYTYLRDYKKLMKHPVCMDEVKAWVTACIVFIENGGNSFLLTKNIKYDPDMDEEIIYYDTIKILALKTNLMVNVNVINPDFDESADENAANTKYLFTDLATALMTLIMRRDLPNYSNVDFYPYLKDQPKLRDAFNLFTGFSMANYRPRMSYEYAQSAMYDHIFRYMCDADKVVFTYLQKWIAYMIQYPSRRPDVAILFVSDQGMGKDMVRRFISAMLGSEYSICFNDVEAFFKCFNKEQANKIFITLNELSDKGTTHSKHDLYKSHITKDANRIEPKGFDAYPVRHSGHYMNFSNNSQCLFIENSDRRFVMIKANSEVANKHEHFDPLWALVSNRDFIKSAFDYYANMDLSDFVVRKIPNTKFKDEQKLNSLPTPMKFLLDVLGDDGFQNIADCTRVCEENSDEITISMKAMFEYYNEWCNDTRTKGTTRDAFKNQLLKLGLKSKRVSLGGDFPKRTLGYKFTIASLEKAFQEYLRMPDFSFNRFD